MAASAACWRAWRAAARRCAGESGAGPTSTAEGEATAHVVGQLARALGLKVTRLARGVPVGSELEYVDLGTIAHALADRR